MATSSKNMPAQPKNAPEKPAKEPAKEKKVRSEAELREAFADRAEAIVEGLQRHVTKTRKLLTARTAVPSEKQIHAFKSHIQRLATELEEASLVTRSNAPVGAQLIPRD